MKANSGFNRQANSRSDEADRQNYNDDSPNRYRYVYDVNFIDPTKSFYETDNNANTVSEEDNNNTISEMIQDRITRMISHTNGGEAPLLIEAKKMLNQGKVDEAVQSLIEYVGSQSDDSDLDALFIFSGRLNRLQQTRRMGTTSDTQISNTINQIKNEISTFIKRFK